MSKLVKQSFCDQCMEVLMAFCNNKEVTRGYIKDMNYSRDNQVLIQPSISFMERIKAMYTVFERNRKYICESSKGMWPFLVP